jgi:transposase
LIAALPPCVIGMEACSGAHHWARLFEAAGHTVRLIAPRFVTPYRMIGKTQPGRITKAGDGDLRSLLILGARPMLAAATKKTDPTSRWATALAERRGYWKAVVAIAAKNARMAWAVLRKGDEFALPA